MSKLCVTCHNAPATHVVMSDRAARFYPATAFRPGAEVGLFAPLVPYCCPACAEAKAAAYTARNAAADAAREAARSTKHAQATRREKEAPHGA